MPTADGQIFVMCVLPKFWEALTHILGAPDLISDDRFATPGARRKNRDALMDILDALTRQHSTAELLELLAGEVPAAPVLDMVAALENPYLEEIDGIASVTHPERDGFRLLRSPIRLDGARLDPAKGPKLGADTDELLESVGYSADDRAALRAEGTIG